MRLKLLTGPAGIGKTSHCIQLFRSKILSSEYSGLNTPAFFILPNQEHSDRIHLLLWKDKRFHGLVNHHVLTINDFIRFKSLRSNQKLITKFERRWLIQELLKATTWSWLERTKDTPGLASVLASFVSEIKSSGLRTSDWLKSSQSLAETFPHYALKAPDLDLLLQQYDDRKNELGWMDPEEAIQDYLEHELVKQEGPLLDLVIFDGFFSFTEVQLQFLRAVAERSREVVVTLTLDHDTSREDVFSYPYRVRKKLLGYGFREVFSKAPIKRFRNLALAHLEETLFRETKTENDKALSDPGIALLEGASPHQEIEMIAREVLQHVRSGEFQFSDHMLVLRNILTYRPVIEEVFDRFGIPYEIHERKRLSENPLLHCILEWMNVFTREKEDIICNVSLLRMFLSWQKMRQNTEGIDGVQKHLLSLPSSVMLGELKALDESSLRGNAQDVWNALLTRIEQYLTLSEPESIRCFFKELHDLFEAESPALPMADQTQSSEEKICWETFQNLLEGYLVQLTSGQMSVQEALDRLRGDLEMGLYSTPVFNKNRVQIYDTALALPKEYRVVFVCGLNEEQFPLRHDENAILKDDERQALLEKGVWLDTAAMREKGERYFFYMAITRASERLFFSRSAYDANGRELLRSAFLDEVEACFNAALPIKKKSFTDVVVPVEEILLPRDVWSGFSREASRNIASEALKTTRGLLEASHEEPIELLERLIRVNRVARIEDPDIRNEFSQDERIFSPSQLSTLHNCHYQHFAQYVLKLKPEDDTNDALVEGELLHAVLEGLFRQWFSNAAKTLPPRKAFLQSAVDLFEARFQETTFQSERAYRRNIRHRELRKTVMKAAEFEYDDLKQRKDLWPAYFELEFGLGGDDAKSLPPMSLTHGETELQFRGRMDRVDVDLVKKRALAVDYKRSEPFSLTKFKKGELPQALLYTLALKRLLKLEPIGTEYVSLRGSKRGGFLKKELYDEEKKNRLRSTLSEEDFHEVEETATNHLFRDIQGFKDAKIVPYSVSCRSCSYYALCRFEGWRWKR